MRARVCVCASVCIIIRAFRILYCVGWPSIVDINSNDVNERITLDYVYKPAQ